MPRPVLVLADTIFQNKVHLHLSADKAGVMESVAAGALQKMKALCAFAMASTNSYAQLPEEMTGGWIGYGTENRDLPIRKIDAQHFEFRCLDVTANVYLSTALLLAEGIDFSLKNKTSPFKDYSLPIRPASTGLAKFGIVERMPVGLHVSLDTAIEDRDLQVWLGEDIVLQYVAIKELEVEHGPEIEDDEKRQRFSMFF